MPHSNLDSLGVNLSRDIIAATDDTIAIRRRIHQTPELGFEETETQAIILSELRRVGIEASALGGTGVVATIEGRSPGKTLLLRADMDALPVQEATALEFKSQTKGKMHACGHDAHVATMLGVAKVLKARGVENGRVKLMFQPAEEGGGGAQTMIDAGVLQSPEVDAALTFHVWTPSPVGTVSVCVGPAAASVDGFKLTITGRGTHAAVPESGVDPIVIASQIVTAAQSIVTRQISPNDPTVLSFTSIQGGNNFNVIPESVTLLGTFRTFDRKIRNTLLERLKTIAAGIAEAMGGSSTYETIVQPFGPVINDPEIAAIANRAAGAVVGPDRVSIPKPILVGEDIGLVQERVPGALVLLGCGNDAIGASFPHHHPKFAIDERVIPIGMEIAVSFADHYLNQKNIT